MLREFSSSSELEEAFELLRRSKQVPLHAVGLYYTLETAVKKQFPPSITVRLFAYPASQPICWAAAMCGYEAADHTFPQLYLLIDETQTETNRVFINELNTAYMSKHPRIEFRNVSTTLRQFIERCLSEQFQLDGKPNVLYPYYIPPELCEKLKNVDVSQRLPPGLRFDQLNEGDEPTVTNTWLYKGKHESDATMAMINYMPNVCLRDAEGKLVAFETTHPSSMMCHLYVMAEHRKKGLGTLTELRLAQILLQRYNYLPWKNIVVDNRKGELMSESSEWFKRRPTDHEICDTVEMAIFHQHNVPPQGPHYHII